VVRLALATIRTEVNLVGVQVLIANRSSLEFAESSVVRDFVHVGRQAVARVLCLTVALNYIASTSIQTGEIIASVSGVDFTCFSTVSWRAFAVLVVVVLASVQP
jgi:hypothetical protein